MSVSLGSFRAMIQTDATRIHVADGGTVIGRGSGLAGRAVAWLEESLGDGKVANQTAIRSLTAAVRSEYGERAGDAVANLLRDRLENGKPLSGRHVQQALDLAEKLVGTHNQRLAERLSDLGDEHTRTDAMDMVRQRIGQGRLSQEAATLLLTPGPDRDELAAAIRQAVETAAKEHGKGELPLPDALIAADRAVETAMRRIQARLETAELLAPRDDGGLHPDIEDLTLGIKRELGLRLPEDSSLADAMTPQRRSDATTALERNLAHVGPERTQADWDESVAFALRPAMADELLAVLRRGPEACDEALAGLRLPPDLDRTKPGMQVLNYIVRELRRDDGDATLDAGRASFEAALLRACRERVEADPGSAPEVLKLLRDSTGLADDDRFRTLPPERQRALLQGVADLGEAAITALQRSGDDVATTRTKTVEALADLVTMRLAAIREETGCSESAALDTLRDTDPGLVAQLDRVLAGDGERPMDGGWLKGRQQLAELRDSARELAQGGEVTGTDMQRLLSAKLRGLSMEIFDNAIASMGRPPPVEFAVLGLGSNARGEASPYSDLEFAILLPEGHSEEDRAYFTELSARVRDQVAALGENDSHFREQGFHFDANLNPIRLPQQFLNSADGLITHGIVEDGGFSSDWSRTSFIGAEWLYGSDVVPGPDGTRPSPTTSWQAVQDFQSKVQTQIRSEQRPGVTHGEALSRWTINLATEMATDGLSKLDDGVVDVKALARLPMLLVQGLALEHGLLIDPETGIAANSIDQRLALLVKGGHVTQEDADKILALQDKLSALRVLSHSTLGRQVDELALTQEVAEARGLLHAPELGGLVEDAQSLLALAKNYLAEPRAQL